MALEDMPAKSLSPQEEETLHALLTDLPIGEPPLDLTARIMGAVAAEEARSQITVVSKKKSVFRWRSLASLAAVLALAFVGTWSLQQGQPATPASSPAQEDANLVPYSIDRHAARTGNSEDDINTAGLIPETQSAAENQRPVVGFSLRTDSVSTPQEALELLVQDWFEAGTSYTLIATQASDTEEISCHLTFTDGERTISEGTVTYLEMTVSGFRFEWCEGDSSPCLFTVTPDGEILQDSIDTPAE